MKMGVVSFCLPVLKGLCVSGTRKTDDDRWIICITNWNWIVPVNVSSCKPQDREHCLISVDVCSTNPGIVVRSSVLLGFPTPTTVFQSFCEEEQLQLYNGSEGRYVSMWGRKYRLKEKHFQYTSQKNTVSVQDLDVFPFSICPLSGSKWLLTEHHLLRSDIPDKKFHVSATKWPTRSLARTRGVNWLVMFPPFLF